MIVYYYISRLQRCYNYIIGIRNIVFNRASTYNRISFTALDNTSLLLSVSENS